MMPPILFLVMHPTEPVVLHYMNNLLELFRLRDVFGTHDARVYRYTKINKTFDLHATFDQDRLWWVVCDTGIGFEETSYESLESNWKFVLSISKVKVQ